MLKLNKLIENPPVEVAHWVGFPPSLKPSVAHRQIWLKTPLPFHPPPPCWISLPLLCHSEWVSISRFFCWTANRCPVAQSQCHQPITCSFHQPNFHVTHRHADRTSDTLVVMFSTYNMSNRVDYYLFCRTLLWASVWSEKHFTGFSRNFSKMTRS